MVFISFGLKKENEMKKKNEMNKKSYKNILKMKVNKMKTI